MQTIFCCALLSCACLAVTGIAHADTPPTTTEAKTTKTRPVRPLPTRHIPVPAAERNIAPARLPSAIVPVQGQARVPVTPPVIPSAAMRSAIFPTTQTGRVLNGAAGSLNGSGSNGREPRNTMRPTRPTRGVSASSFAPAPGAEATPAAPVGVAVPQTPAALPAATRRASNNTVQAVNDALNSIDRISQMASGSILRGSKLDTANAAPRRQSPRRSAEATSTTKPAETPTEPIPGDMPTAPTQTDTTAGNTPAPTQPVADPTGTQTPTPMPTTPTQTPGGTAPVPLTPGGSSNFTSIEMDANPFTASVNQVFTVSGVIHAKTDDDADVDMTSVVGKRIISIVYYTTTTTTALNADGTFSVKIRAVSRPDHGSLLVKFAGASGFLKSSLRVPVVITR